jgi:hypothetical protein
MADFKTSTQPRTLSGASVGSETIIFRFGYGKASSDPAAAGVPDRSGSEVFVLQKLRVVRGNIMLIGVIFQKNGELNSTFGLVCATW